MVLYYYELNNEILGKIWDSWFAAFEEKYGAQNYEQYSSSCKNVVLLLKERLDTEDLDIEISDDNKDDFIYQLTKFFFFPKTKENPQINYIFVVLEEMCKELSDIDMHKTVGIINDILLKNEIMVQFFGNLMISVDNNVLLSTQLSSALMIIVAAKFKRTISPYMHAISAYKKREEALLKNCISTFEALTIDFTSLFTKKPIKTQKEAISDMRSIEKISEEEIKYIESTIQYITSLQEPSIEEDRHLLFSITTNFVIWLGQKAVGTIKE